MGPSIQTLQHAIDQLIVKYGATNPELCKDLISLRAEIKATAGNKPVSAQTVVRLALKVAWFVKFFLGLTDDELP